MALVVNGDGNITGLSVGGLPNGVVNSSVLDSSLIPVGVSQVWQNVAASRAVGTTYTNSTGRPIVVCFTPNASAGLYGYAQVGGTNLLYQQFTPSGGGGCAPMVFVVPNGSTYNIVNSSNMSSILLWMELR